MAARQNLLSRWFGGSKRDWMILMYHRVAEVRVDPWRLCVSPSRFQEHLEVLKDFAPVIRLRELADQVAAGRPPGRSVAITFDDGYVDNLQIARPLLERFGMNATVFVVTSRIGKEDEFWWDELERILLSPGILPANLSFDINGKKIDIDVSESQDAYMTIWRFIQPLPDSEIQSAMERIRSWAGQQEIHRESYRSLSAAEVIQLTQDDLVEVGAHSVTHPVLPNLSGERQLDEIRQSKLDLEAILGKPVNSFAYPGGHFNKESIEAVREAGFLCACTGVPLKGEPIDAFRLPRMPVEDWNGDEFAKRLSSWLG